MQLNQIKIFFFEKYPEAVSSKCRKREIVMQRRMIVNFLFSEAKQRSSTIAKIFDASNQTCGFFLRRTTDLEYEKFYQSETEKFRVEYFERFGKVE